MAKKKPKPGSAQTRLITVSMTPSLVARLEAQATRFNVRRAAYIRDRLTRALEADEASAG